MTCLGKIFKKRLFFLFFCTGKCIGECVVLKGVSHDSPGGDKQNKERKRMCADACWGEKIHANNMYQVHFFHSKHMLRKY